MDHLWYNKNKPIALSDSNFGFFATRCSSGDVKLNVSFVQTYDFKRILESLYSFNFLENPIRNRLFQTDSRSFKIIELIF